MYHKKKEDDIRTPLDYGISRIDGKWDTRLLCQLFSSGTLRYSELKTRNPGLSDSVLSSTLSSLLDTGLIEKSSFGREKNPISSYSLTTKGKNVVDSLKDICHLVCEYEEGSNYKVPSYCQSCEALKTNRA